MVHRHLLHAVDSLLCRHGFLVRSMRVLVFICLQDFRWISPRRGPCPARRFLRTHPLLPVLVLVALMVCEPLVRQNITPFFGFYKLSHNKGMQAQPLDQATMLAAGASTIKHCAKDFLR